MKLSSGRRLLGLGLQHVRSFKSPLRFSVALHCPPSPPLIEEEKHDILICAKQNIGCWEVGYAYTWFVLKGGTNTPEPESLLPYLTPEPPKDYKGSSFTSIGPYLYMCGGRYFKLRPIKWTPEMETWKIVFGYNYFKPRSKEEAKRGEGHTRYTRYSVFTNEVYYLDTRCPNNGWRKASPMNAARAHHYAFTHHGKLYVVGCHDPNDLIRESKEPKLSQPWAEVYCPTSDTWRPLPDIPDDFLDKGMLEIKKHSVLGKKIVFYSSKGQVFFYDMELESWGASTEKYHWWKSARTDEIWFGSHEGGYWISENSSVFMDGFIYFVNPDDNALHAYDVTKPSFCSKDISGLSMPRELLPVPVFEPDTNDTMKHYHYNIVSLGNGKLAVLWRLWVNPVDHEEYGRVSAIRCTKIQVVKVENNMGGEPEYEAKLIDSSIYYLPGDCHIREYSLDSCVSVVGSEIPEV